MTTRDGGFTILEMLVASAIVLTITGAVFHLMNPAQASFQAQPEIADLQQRLRVGVEALSSELLMAGAGTGAGPSAGPLSSYFAPVLPYRVGDRRNDPDAGVLFRDDAISLLYVPATPSQAATLSAIPRTAAELQVESRANCPPPAAGQVCGFVEGMRILLFDAGGAWDPITITGVQGDTLGLAYEGNLAAPYGAGAAIAQLAMHTFYLKAGTSQLMHYDGGAADLPLVDDVVGLAFEYLGDPQPPERLPDRPLSDAGPWTTYGPRPPEVGVPGPFGWPDGENCAFLVVDGQHVPRLPMLAAGVGQVRLTSALLTDGPWCPGAASVRRFDADLLRVRRVRVTLRVQAASAALRGRGELFVRPGTSAGGERLVPDQEIRFDVTPRNLNLAR